MIFIKTSEQIEGVRKSSGLTAKVLRMLREEIRSGMSTDEINNLAHEMIVRNGAIPAPLNYNGFPKSICTSRNSVICHGIPSSDEIVEDGDIINVDVTCILDGYYGDASIMLEIGEVSDKAREIVRISRECLYLGLEQVKPNNFIGDIGYAIQTHAEKHGYSVVRAFMGHGTGIHFHEPPNIPHYGIPGDGHRILEGMTFTVEPMINEGAHDHRLLEDDWTAVTRDGGLSAQWEHTIVVTEDGCEILTV